jgi:predicted porin
MVKKNFFLAFILLVTYTDSAFCQIQIPTLTQKKMQIGLNAGTMFSFLGNQQTAFSTYANPFLNYNFSPKWHLQTGLLLLNQQFRLDMPLENQRQNFSTNNAFLMLGLAYDVNERLQVGGMVYANIHQLHQQSLQNFNAKNWGMLIKASYKVTENFFIHGAVNISNGRNPYLSPWNNPAFQHQWNTPRIWGW